VVEGALQCEDVESEEGFCILDGCGGLGGEKSSSLLLNKGIEPGDWYSPQLQALQNLGVVGYHVNMTDMSTHLS
jgi:hypothetical protein